jgi:ABC-type glycerol-3-phosphate transport system permease component
VNRTRRRRIASKTTVYLLLTAGISVVMLPFAFMLTTSLKPQARMFEFPPRLLPTETTLDNYTAILEREQFGLYFLNSFAVAVTATALTVLVSSMLAYAFARLEFSGKEIIFYGLLVGMMIPPVMLIIPQFIIAKQLSLLNSLTGLIVVYITMNLALQTFLLRGFFEGIPRDIEEAAFIDGARRWTILWRIVLPLSRPGLAVVAIFTFLYSWDEFPWAHVAIQETTKRTLPIAIALFHGQHVTEWGKVFAASVLALIPVVLVFAFFQRYFVRGISTTGLKG